ncbi:GIY-YIG nuclease family protein [Vibrio sp. RE86]|uniref:GIY-YIG nuclease family protein n=1 Tax=Vibrio sp. RE86 TaxID=2607605 RepID=UPI001493594D|nr:GIY-YIG nuclease family protein [Vibrio sp. RE86]NOH82095.1 GIY-YIG nuclease family protein [Vibrio sp. RE86]
MTFKNGEFDERLGTYVYDDVIGHVYIACFQPGETYKVGITTNLDNRLNQLKSEYRKSDIFYVYYKYFLKPFRVEQELLAEYSDNRKYESYLELIRLNFDELKEMQYKLFNTSPSIHSQEEYIDWRESLLQRHQKFR